MTTLPVIPVIPVEWLEGIRHVCCDKDGTLIDVHRYWSHTSRLRAERLRERFGFPPEADGSLLDAMGIDEATQTIKPGGPVGYAPRPVIIEAVRRWFAGRSAVAGAEEIAEMFRQVDQHQQATGDYRIEVLPGAAAFLRSLRERGITVSVYTSDRREHGLQMLKQTSLAPYVAEVVGGGCVTRPKPDPEGFLVACKRVRISPAESAYVGDTVDDLAMGRSGGAKRVFGVATGLDSVEELAAHTAYVCGRLAEEALEAPERLYNATVTVLKERPDARVIRVVPDGAAMRYQAGQYGSLGLQSDRNPGRLIKRPYSLASPIVDSATGALVDHSETGHYEFYFNRIPAANGRESLTPKLFALKTGDRIHCGRKITGYYTLDQIPRDRHLLFVDSTTGESANNALINQALREKWPARICQLSAGPDGWRSLYEAEHAALMARMPAYRYHAIAGSYQALESKMAAWLRDPGLAEEALGFPLAPERCQVFLCGDPQMIGAPAKQGAWRYQHAEQGLIPLLTAAGFTLSTRFKQGTIAHEAYW